MFKIINKNRNHHYDVPVIHADGKLDSVQVMGPKRPVYLRDGMVPAPAAFANSDLHITEVDQPTPANSQVIISAPAVSAPAVPADKPSKVK